MKLLHTWSYIDHSTPVWELLFLVVFHENLKLHEYYLHVSLVYVHIRNAGHGTGVDVLSHAGTGGFFFVWHTWFYVFFHGLGALVVVVAVFHDLSPRRLNYEHATWHRCWCPATYKWLFVVWNFEIFVCDLNSRFRVWHLGVTTPPPPPPSPIPFKQKKKRTVECRNVSKQMKSAYVLKRPLWSFTILHMKRGMK